MYFRTGYYPRRYDPIGRQNGERNNASVVWAHDQNWYKFVQNYTLSDEVDRDCPPPYNDKNNIRCYDLGRFWQNASHIDDPVERRALGVLNKM
jgi:hypothetical protein